MLSLRRPKQREGHDTMQCKLCKRDSPLVKSHVIPEFMYSALYDEKHRFRVISTRKEQKNIFAQKGIREPLLCSNCELKLSKHERYASLVFRGKIELSTSSEGNLTFVKGLDYSAFKLFALSILWRAGVSCLPEFKDVRLGIHEDTLRKMILSDDPGQPKNYGFLISPIMHQGKQLFDVIVSPTWSRLCGHYAYRFIIGGMSWIFVVSNHSPPAHIAPAYLSRQGELLMCKSELHEMSFLIKMARDLKEAGKLDINE